MVTVTGGDDVGAKVAVLVFLLLTTLWNSAAILLLSGRHAGRFLAMICWGIGSAVCVAALISIALDEVAEGWMFILYLPLLALCGSALACAAAPATKRWVEYRTRVRIEKYR
ncbi:hypothetical protein [Nocardia flavorosea]|uniref:hypothetical protein n=1 Tax=Nocardia flavorosea TaxID=53429 RepID=UPI002455F5F2|nr:hypothetical protein [Nocardia flavorosea]